ncbi:response regulator [Reichenbachiella versicolor]|uniref:response regulator n=1 Tax=Reichenbachiella versicolor TaxID=1821036 RepID=UPI000D6E04A1|nr:response regulator [Reichenbachiella versicolor]
MELVLQRPQRKESVKKYSVLYVDDEPVNLRIFQHAFKRDYNIYTALNGFDALEILNEKHIDLIITDQQMPRMSGVDLLAKIVPKHPNIVRMIMTGFSDIGAIIRAVNEFGLDKYLVKPWDRDQLKVEFDKALAKKEKEQSAMSAATSGESVVKVSDSMLPRESDLQKIVENSFIVHDSTPENNNSYWFSEKDGKILVSLLSTSKNSASLVGLKSFISLNLIESVYRIGNLDPSEVLSVVLTKVKERYFDSSETLGDLDISMVVIDPDNKKIEFSGVNQNTYYFDSNEKMKMLNGGNESWNIKGNDLPQLKTNKADDVTEVYFISKGLFNQTVTDDNGAADGVSFLQYLRSIHQLPMSEQSSKVADNLNLDSAKTMIGLSIK